MKVEGDERESHAADAMLIQGRCRQEIRQVREHAEAWQASEQEMLSEERARLQEREREASAKILLASKGKGGSWRSAWQQQEQSRAVEEEMTKQMQRVQGRLHEARQEVAQGRHWGLQQAQAAKAAADKQQQEIRQLRAELATQDSFYQAKLNEA